MGSPSALANSCVWGVFFTLLRLFYPPEAKQNSCGVIFCLRGLRRFLFASGVSRYVLSGSTFYERFSGVDFVMWCIPDPRNFYSTLILARFNVFCSVEGKLPEFARLVSALLAYCPGSCQELLFAHVWQFLRSFDGFLRPFCVRFLYKCWRQKAGCVFFWSFCTSCPDNEKCYESSKSATTANWAFICVTNEGPGMLWWGLCL